MRTQWTLWMVAAFVTLTLLPLPAHAAAPRGLGDPGALTGLRIEPSREGQGILIRGRDSRQQLFVTGVYATGQLRDHTRSVQYAVEPNDVVQIDAAGYVTPLKDGKAVVRAVASGAVSAELPIEVSGVAVDVPINFPNQVVPIFTKLSCNSGGCHGKASGQNGFKLSLLGFYPEDDHEFLVKEGRGRRVFPTAPAQSLLLTKPVGQSPHGGGKRMDLGSYEYRLISRWIEQGMPYGKPEDPHVVGIKCLPPGRVMDRGTEQQITVQAMYSDGSTEDVTRMALFEANDVEMAEVNATGLVRTLDLAGEVAIMARYQGQVATFRSTVPLGAEIAARPPIRNFIDEAVFGKLDVLGIPPSPVADDATFLRRISVDLTGTLPTEAEVKAFLADSDPAKRDKLIDRLLDTPEYADYFANKWNMVLRNKRQNNDLQSSTFAFYRWIWGSLYENKPYDQFVRELLTASGSADDNPAVTWYREVDQTNEQVEDVAQLFLGLRIQCARCHHHPFEKWSQDDYYSLSAFFSRVGKKNIVGGNNQSRDKRIFHQDNQGPAQARNERTGKMLSPAGLGSAALSLPAEDDPRVKLADWMADPQNPFFAKALVNRYWKHFFSRGIVEPEDDMRETNPPANPELLDKLAAHFVQSKFDLKELVRAICRSSTYQLTSLPNEYNLKDKQNFSRYYPKRLTAEVLYDGFHQVTGTTQSFGGLPAGTRSIEIPDATMAQNVYFLKVFGQPQADTACECERSQEANLAQSLHLLNSNEVQSKVSAGNARPALFANDKARNDEDKIRELYRWVYAREPDADELRIGLAHVQKHAENPKLAFEDITWALINTKEFLFNH
ncbi:MAG TPA: DUF1549 and DUF1553 domain-containing protein [Planctomycetaceae bacterium]|nr:DUF1549 and DUF1553 domain-containing protein [Planctomycetaceae bacterium]